MVVAALGGCGARQASSPPAPPPQVTPPPALAIDAVPELPAPGAPQVVTPDGQEIYEGGMIVASAPTAANDEARAGWQLRDSAGATFQAVVRYIAPGLYVYELPYQMTSIELVDARGDHLGNVRLHPGAAPARLAPPEAERISWRQTVDPEGGIATLDVEISLRPGAPTPGDAYAITISRPHDCAPYMWWQVAPGARTLHVTRSRAQLTSVFELDPREGVVLAWLDTSGRQSLPAPEVLRERSCGAKQPVALASNVAPSS